MSIQRVAPKLFAMNKCTIDMTHVIGKPWESSFQVMDRNEGTVELITDPRTSLTKAFLEEPQSYLE